MCEDKRDDHSNPPVRHPVRQLCYYLTAILGQSKRRSDVTYEALGISCLERGIVF